MPTIDRGTSAPGARGTSTAPPRPDSICADAVDAARAAITEVGPEQVGDHVAVVPEGERVVTHLFACLRPGYQGWRWAVTVTRVPRGRRVTISETVLLPGPDALLAPEWVPWEERLAPGDLGVGDVLPTPADDERLAPGYQHSDDPALADLAWELGLGRARVMSRAGRSDTAERWYAGDGGPDAAISTAAPRDARCGSCGFFLPMAGALRQAFGACGNRFAPDDGRVVSVDHGCGAHSEVPVAGGRRRVDALPTVYDDGRVERV